MTESLIWIAIIFGIPSLLVGIGMGAAFILAGRADDRSDREFTGDQWL